MIVLSTTKADESRSRHGLAKSHVGLETLRHLHRFLELMNLLVLLVLLLLLQLRLLLLLLLGRAMTLVAAVPVARVEAEPDLGEPQCLLGRHLRLLSVLVLLVMHALGVHPGPELARVLGHDGVSVFGLVLPGEEDERVTQARVRFGIKTWSSVNSNSQQFIQPLVPGLDGDVRPLGRLATLEGEPHLLQRRLPLGRHRARLALLPILVVPPHELHEAAQRGMVHGDPTVTVRGLEIPQPLHLIVPRGVGSPRAEREAQLGEALHLHGVERRPLPRLAGHELIVHPALRGDP